MHNTKVCNQLQPWNYHCNWFVVRFFNKMCMQWFRFAIANLRLITNLCVMLTCYFTMTPKDFLPTGVRMWSKMGWTLKASSLPSTLARMGMISAYACFSSPTTLDEPWGTSLDREAILYRKLWDDKCNNNNKYSRSALI